MENICIENIPAIIWSEKSDKVYIHVHGKMSCKEYAKEFAAMAEKKGYQTISFDLPKHGQRKNEGYPCTIENAIHDLKQIADYAFSNWEHVSLYGCSIGAYFSLQTYIDRKFEKCLFQSPILDMEHLIKKMFVWFNISEEQLYNKQEIVTPIETMSWTYYQYVKNHPITQWTIPTSILYGKKDTLQDVEVMNAFVDRFSCALTVSTTSDHPFMEIEDCAIVNAWLEENI